MEAQLQNIEATSNESIEPDHRNGPTTFCPIEKMSLLERKAAQKLMAIAISVARSESGARNTLSRLVAIFTMSDVKASIGRYPFRGGWTAAAPSFS